MKTDIIKETMKVKDQTVGVMIIDGKEYISLTDLARYIDKDNPSDLIKQWMSNKDSFDFYGLWEEINNKDFKLAESRKFKKISANQSFTMSPSKWINMTNAKGFVTKRGKYEGGTFAHSNIAFEFAGWLSPEFKLYLITEFERLKKEESWRNKLDWHANRVLKIFN